MTAFHARLSHAEMSACRQKLPAETALAEARVMPLVLGMRSSAVACSWEHWKTQIPTEVQVMEWEWVVEGRGGSGQEEGGRGQEGDAILLPLLT